VTVIDLHKALSVELRELLSALYGADFSDRLVDRVVRRLVSPKRLSLCKRLSYLMSVLIRLDLDPFEFFYSESLSAHTLAAMLSSAQRDPAGAGLVEGNVSAPMSDGSVFNIPLPHLAELICTAHAIGEWLGPEQLYAANDQISVAPDDVSTVDAAAAELAKAFDQHRQRRVGSSTARMKRKAVLEFMARAHEGEGYNAADITSDKAKTFWMQYCNVRDLDVKTYAGVHALFETFIEVLDEYLEVEISGDVDTAQPGFSLNGQEDWIALRAEAGRMKFLFPTQIERGVLFTDAAQSAWRMRPSAAWAACYAPVQSRLTDSMSADAYHRAWDAANDWDFALQTVTTLAEKMDEVTRAVLHMLIVARKLGAVPIAYYFVGDDMVDESIKSVNPTLLSEEDILELQYQQLDRLCDGAEPIFVDLRQSAQRAWKNIRRDGFHASDLENPDYMKDVDCLSSRFIGALGFIERLRMQWQAVQPEEPVMRQTRDEFDRTFKTIYRPGEAARVSP
jgi:hypothetical protein